jgi:hypothetical protein
MKARFAILHVFPILNWQRGSSIHKNKYILEHVPGETRIYSTLIVREKKLYLRNTKNPYPRRYGRRKDK